MKFLYIILILISFSSCFNNKTKQTASEAEERIFTFDSVITIDDEYVPLLNTNVFVKTPYQNVANEINDDLVFYHKLLDQYHYYNGNNSVIKNVKIINDYISNKENIVIDESLFYLLKSSFKLMDLTNGYFNIFINPVLDLYDGKFTSFPIENTDPDKEKINSALKNVLKVSEYKNKIILNDKEHKIYVNSSKDNVQFSINLGAISKGFIANKIKEKYSDSQYLLNLGNSTIFASGREYKIGILSPYNNRSAILHINLPASFSLSTSGTSNNYYILKDDKKTVRTHIINPYTGYSNDYYWSDTIISDNAIVSDALTTALFNINDINSIKEIINSVKKEFNCSIEVCFIKEVSRLKKEVILLMTKGFETYINTEYKNDSIVGTEIIEL